jgi:hypothetical protein
VAIRQSRYFGDKGDSGAWVLDKEGRLGGLFIGGNEATELCYVTPISVVLEDIQTRLGCSVTLPQ